MSRSTVCQRLVGVAWDDGDRDEPQRVDAPAAADRCRKMSVDLARQPATRIPTEASTKPQDIFHNRLRHPSHHHGKRRARKKRETGLQVARRRRRSTRYLVYRPCLAEPEPCHSRAGIRNTVQESIIRARLRRAKRFWHIKSYKRFDAAFDCGSTHYFVWATARRDLRTTLRPC
jgi:hypothetical protein